MSPVPETRLAAVRADEAGALVLAGVAMRYGDEARVGQFRERFEAGAFGDVASLDAILNRQHDRRVPLARTGGGGLVLDDTPEALSFRAELADTQDARDAVALVRAGVLRDVSVEFVATDEAFRGDLRIVRKASLRGFAVVDRGAYSATEIQARAAASATRRRIWI